MTGPWTLIGVPTSAGAHHAGQDQAPAALRAAGLVDRLRAAGVTVHDAGDLPGAVFAVDHARPHARNLTAVVQVASEVADAAEAVARAGQRPLVVGGDCTITVGVVAGIRRVHPDLGLAYVDADADLTSSLSGDGSGILDATGVWHLLGHGEPELAGLDGAPPLIEGARLAMVGLDPRELTEAGRRFLAANGVNYIEGPQFMADPQAAARQALRALRVASGPMIVHFDVDVVDSGDLPLGNYPHYNSGVSLGAVASALAVLLADPSCAALVLTEVNPSYDPGGGQLDRYIEALVTAVAGG